MTVYITSENTWTPEVSNGWPESDTTAIDPGGMPDPAWADWSEELDERHRLYLEEMLEKADRREQRIAKLRQTDELNSKPKDRPMQKPSTYG